MKEQEEPQKAKQSPSDELLQYARTNLHEIEGNPTPLPPDLDDTWVIYLYEKTLEKEIKKFQVLFLNKNTTNHVVRGSGRQEDPVVLSNEESSEDGLASFYPNKKYAVHKIDKKRKKKKRRKKRKRKRKRHQSSIGTSHSSEDSTEEESNSKRVNVNMSSYGPNHYEQLQEFRDDYRAYYDDRNAGDWPEREALTFIAKKFARAGLKFAHKTEGVRTKKFVSGPEHDHVRKRTVQIYDMADTIAELRLERNEQIDRGWM